MKILASSIVVSIITSSILYAESKYDTFDKITVTANKMEENIQEVPQSISVIEATTLQEKGVNNISDIIREIPNMLDVPNNGVSANIRGLNTSAFTNNNPIVIYIDGIPMADRYVFDIPLTNVERIEVLRGPQGTLYGKDAIGGVINVITKEPSNVHAGSINSEYGSFNTHKNKINLSGALKDDTLFYGINAQINSSDGWVNNRHINNDKANKLKDNFYNGYLLLQPTEALSMKLNLMFQDYKKDWGTFAALPWTSKINEFERDDAKSVNFDVPTFEEKKVNAQALRINYQIKDLLFNSVTTRKNIDIASDFDLDYDAKTPKDGLKRFNYMQSDEYTQEFRLSSNQESIKWITGLYFDYNKREQDPYGGEYFVPAGVPGFLVDTIMKVNAASTSKSNTQALFGQISFPIINDLDMTLGLRYQRISKEIDLKTYTEIPKGTTSMSFPLKDKNNWNTLLPKLALSYKFSENIKPFLSISKGYMPGGYNYFARGGTVENNSFEAQTSINYEIGIKSVFDNFSINASIFRMDIKDIHVFKAIAPSMFITDNAKKAHSQGLEIDFNYFPSDEWEITGAFGLIDAKYDDYDLGGGVKYDGKTIQNTPKYTANLAIAYYHPRGFYGRIDTRVVGDTHYENFGSKTLEKYDAYALANVKFGYRFKDLDIYAYVNNITDKEYITSYINDGSLSLVTYGDPRVYGVGFKYSF